MARQFDYDENKLKPLQREAAIALVEYEFTPKGQRKTKQEIADEIGITRQCLHKWDTRDKNFIAYKNSLAADFMDTHTAFVYKKLIDSIDRGSVRGIELFMKRLGDLADQQEVTIKQDTSEASFEERREELMKRLGLEAEKAKAEKAGKEADK